MVRALNRLTAVQVSKLTKPRYYPDGGGLYLQVSPTGSKSWIFRYELNGRPREMGLGSLNDYCLAEAREFATDNRRLLKRRQDPIEVRNNRIREMHLANAKRVTFDQCAKQFIDAHKSSWKSQKHAQQFENTIATYASPHIGSLWVNDIDTGLVLKCLEPIWADKTETATRLRSRMEKILDWAATRNYRSGENPARWKGHLEFNLAAPSKIAKVEHQPALPYLKIYDFIKDLRTREGMAAKALEFGILAACRSNEVRQATWGEVSFDEGVWTIPAARMKMENEHRVPLSSRCIEILKSIQSQAQDDGQSTKPSDYIFPNKKGEALSDATLNAVIKRMNEDEDEPIWVDPKANNRQIVQHGFRSTFRDWAAECSNHDSRICEKALAHLVGDETERAYQRGDLLQKRRLLMEDWATYCSHPHNGASVVPFRQSVGS